MIKMTKILSLLAAVALWQGCSSTSDSSDASVDDAAVDVAVDAPTVFLSRGTNYYKITAVANVSDACDIGATDFVNAVIPVTFTEAGAVLSVGNMVGVPLQPSLGTGNQIGVTGTLNRENDVTDGNCTWHQKDVSAFTLTGGDIFTLSVTENQSAFTAQCAPPNTPCMTTYTATFAKTTAPADGGTGG